MAALGGTLSITVAQLAHLPKMDTFGKCDPGEMTFSLRPPANALAKRLRDFVHGHPDADS
eukprot:3136726-Rhodomonas_salina.4